jgi:hypothetical protein
VRATLDPLIPSFLGWSRLADWESGGYEAPGRIPLYDRFPTYEHAEHEAPSRISVHNERLTGALF